MNGPPHDAIERGRRLDDLGVAIERTRQEWHQARIDLDAASLRQREAMRAVIEAEIAHRAAVIAYEAAK